MNSVASASGIAICSIDEWVEAVHAGRVVLPMIQRGSVWKPHQILDLWDTLLQGMPLGAFMASPVSEAVLDLITREITQAPADAVNLLDGQQRTLAILSAWPGIEHELVRRVAVWVDLGEDPQGEYGFRLWVTTRAQPFGYERASAGGQPLAKLSAADRRNANAVYCPSPDAEHDVVTIWDSGAFMPWRAKFALRLSELIGDPGKLDSIEDILDQKGQELGRLLDALPQDGTGPGGHGAKHLEMRRGSLKGLSQPKHIGKVRERAQLLKQAIQRLPGAEFPLIKLAGFLDHEPAAAGDPLIAVLFKRIGTSGQPLSDPDYTFAVLKHHEPDIHDLVETLLSPEQKPAQIPALYTANDLVMTAVRMQLLQLRATDLNVKAQEEFHDKARIDKARFARLVRKQGRGADQNGSKFAKDFRDLIAPNGQFATTLNDIFAAVAYTDQFQEGLPRHAIPWLVDRFLFDVLLAWFIQSEANPRATQLPLVRFLLWGFLCITDKAAASELCIRQLPTLRAEGEFPERALMTLLIKEGRAHPLPCPTAIQAVPGLAFADEANGDRVLKGGSRFEGHTNTDTYLPVVYQRWWNIRRNRHEHPFLLWLQRGFVDREFERQPALAGMEDETPYDFDHILPQSNWRDWRGIQRNDRLIDFAHDQGGHHVLGNAIGNLRVWPAGRNREDGDASPAVKLRLGLNEDDVTGRDICSKSCIEGVAQMEGWRAVSALEGALAYAWNADRARAFQKAVEARTFALYESFYRDLRFGDLESCFNAARTAAGT